MDCLVELAYKSICLLIIKFTSFNPVRIKNLSENNYNIFNNCLYIVSDLKQFISSINSRAL
jgi:hypothetical protein